jgi:predicted ArsR family transcriptional regulator
MTIVPDNNAPVEVTDDLSQKERDLLVFLGSFSDEHHYAPSHLEASRALGCSPALVRFYIKRLVAKGYVRAVRHQPRTITVLKR